MNHSNWCSIASPFVRDFDRNYSLIAAANMEGFVVPACTIVEREHGSDDPNPNRGTVDAERFMQYVEEDLCPQLGSYKLGEPNSVVVMDNASVHDASKIRALIEKAGAILIYTAPYCPFLNPIENMFKVYKDSLKRLSHDRSRHWLSVHFESLTAVTPKSAQNFFRNCQVPKMDWWLAEQAARPEKAGDLLPHPFNGWVDSLLDLV